MRDAGHLAASEVGNAFPLSLPPFRGGEKRGEAPGQDSSDRENAAEWVRENLPQCAEFAAAVRESFGSARMCYAEEAGHVIGKPFLPAFVVPADTLIQEPIGGKGKR